MGVSAAINHNVRRVSTMCAAVLDRGGVDAKPVWSQCKSEQLKKTHWQELTPFRLAYAQEMLHTFRHVKC